MHPLLLEGTTDKQTSQWKYYQQLSFLTDVFTPRNMKSNIPPPDVATILVDVSRTCVTYLLKILISKRCQQNQCQNPKIRVQLQITPFQLTHHVIRRQGGKEKSGKSQALSQLLALEEREIEQLEKAVQQKSIISTQEDEDYQFDDFVTSF